MDMKFISTNPEDWINDLVSQLSTRSLWLDQGHARTMESGWGKLVRRSSDSGGEALDFGVFSVGVWSGQPSPWGCPFSV